MSHNILVIEDNPDNSRLVTWILEDEGYQTTCVPTAEEGLDLLQGGSFDIVLMDISLPGMDGKQATREIRKNPELSHLPVLALTAHAISGEHELIMQSGVDDLITKPLDETLLTERIQELLTTGDK